jgi:GNAT superfamily N-acetyltransferase
MTQVDRNAANLVEALSIYGDTHDAGAIRIIDSGTRFAVFNIAVSLRAIPSAEDLAQCVESASRHFEPHKQPWSIWICEAHLGRTAQRALFPQMDQAGLSCIGEPPGMEAPEMKTPWRILPPVEVRRASDPETRRDFVALVEECFHIPAPVADTVYGRATPWREPLQGWVGYWDGRPISTTATVRTHGLLGIYSVCTRPELRKRGLAEAVMRAVIREERAAGAEGPLALQSSPMGEHLYKTLGFRRITKYWVFAMPQANL